MPYVKIPTNPNEWILIGEDVSSITFQNAGQFGVYINFTSANTAPSDAYGLVYGPFQGELRRDLIEMTSISSPTHVWAKAMSKPVNLIVEQ
jgi:hypothetical protein